MTRAAIVTGSDSGIGKATAVALAHAGFDVGITWHRDESGAHATAQEVRAAGRRCEVAALDLTGLPAAAEAVDHLADALGGVHVHEHEPKVGSSAYCAAKGGLGLLTKVMALERRDAAHGPDGQRGDRGRRLAAGLTADGGHRQSGSDVSNRSYQRAPSSSAATSTCSSKEWIDCRCSRDMRSGAKR
jgi:hypothetical protein